MSADCAAFAAKISCWAVMIFWLSSMALAWTSAIVLRFTKLTAISPATFKLLTAAAMLPMSMTTPYKPMKVNNNILLDKRHYVKYYIKHGYQSTKPLDQGRSCHYGPSSGVLRRKGRCGIHGEAALGRSSSLPALWRSGRVPDEGCQDRRAASKLPVALPRLQGSIHGQDRHGFRGQPDRASALVLRVLAL